MVLDPHWQAGGSSPHDVVSRIRSGDRVFVHGAAATPSELLEALCDRQDIGAVQLYHLHLAGECRFTAPEYAGKLVSNSLFTGPALREPIAQGRADFIPAFLSDIPALFRSRRIPLDVALVQLSPPDQHGNCTLGTSVDAALQAVESASTVLAVINLQMPRTHGNTVVPLHRVNAFTVVDRPIHAHPAAAVGGTEARIGEVVAALIPDRATLQLGIGAIPDAVLARLGDKNDLGVHTEMFSDGLLPLLEAGVITNRYKTVHPNRTVTSFVSGSKRLYDFVHDNASIEFHPCDRTNDTALIRKNPRVCAINSALEIDLSGQVCADSIGHRIYSGIGGQMDFVRAAVLSEGGKAIIALPSTAAGGKFSRIAASLRPGAGVVTTRGHVHWVATEFGAVDLHGLTLRQRGEALISIAHPDFRASLAAELRNIRHFAPGPVPPVSQ